MDIMDTKSIPCSPNNYMTTSYGFSIWTLHLFALKDMLSAQSLDTDVQRPFYSVATVGLLPFLIWEENDGGHVE